MTKQKTTPKTAKPSPKRQKGRTPGKKKAIAAISKMAADPAIAEAKNILYRKPIGHISVVQGEAPTRRTGRGLKHIVAKHGKEITSQGSTIPELIVTTVRRGKVTKKPDEPKYEIRLNGKKKSSISIIKTELDGKSKNWVLTTYYYKVETKQKRKRR